MILGIIAWSLLQAPLYSTCMGILLVSVGSLLSVGEHIFSQIRSIYAGIHDPLFVATNIDPADMVLGASQR